MLFGLSGLFASPALLVFIIIIIHVSIAVLFSPWVHNDAKKREMNALTWTLIVLITGIIGWIIYLIARR
jgi:hypothetical protein